MQTNPPLSLLTRTRGNKGKEKQLHGAQGPFFSFANNVEKHIEHDIRILSHHDHLNCDFKSLNEIILKFLKLVSKPMWHLNEGKTNTQKEK